MIQNLDRLSFLNLLKKHRPEDVIKEEVVEETTKYVDIGNLPIDKAEEYLKNTVYSADGITWSGCGNKMYVAGNNKIHQYSLNNPYDVSSATYLGMLKRNIAHAFNGASSDNRPIVIS